METNIVIENGGRSSQKRILINQGVLVCTPWIKYTNIDNSMAEVGYVFIYGSV
jgi:hypothetical protein